MRDDVAKDLSDSAFDFLRVVWPVVKDFCQGGDLKPVESVSPGEFEKQLDVLAGIDAWQIVNDTGIRGISSRIQWVKRGGGWPTFTIRKSRSNGARTEWDKRIEAMRDKDGGFIRPALLVHAYIQNPRRSGALEYVCMCRADDLFELATDEYQASEDVFDREPEKAWYEKTNPIDGNTFAVFPVQRLRSLGVRVRSWDVTDQRIKKRPQDQTVAEWLADYDAA